MASLKLLLSPPTFYRCPNPPFPAKSPLLFSPLPNTRSTDSGFLSAYYRFPASTDDDDDDEAGSFSFDEAGSFSFDEAVELFNRREYYRCHDSLEALWNGADEPSRTLFHAILQCAVGFHHLFNQNHKGAMMELGEGLCKLRKMDFRNGPFHEFEQDITRALEFIYQTQIELAACSDDLCVAMDRSERSYELLGGYAAGRRVYELQVDPNDQTVHIVFRPRDSYANGEPPRVKLPTLDATGESLKAFQSY